jgi:four helix bundle protein
MRDHNKLDAFHAADAVVAAVCDLVRSLPTHERYALGLQLRRASLSAASNIVEGCARETASDFAHFLTIAYASARETQYQIEVALRLGYIDQEKAVALRDAAARSSQMLNRLLARVRRFRAADSPRK